MRASFSDLPRWHVFFDMDFQPKKKPQQTTTIFKDGRSMRPPVPATVSREQLTKEDPFYLGYDPLKVTVSLNDDDKSIFVSTNSNSGAIQPPAAGDGGQAPKLPFLDKLPIEANEANMKLGKTKYETYCAACHGYTGYGDGLVAKRAASLQQDTWAPPTSLHADRVQKQLVGNIFHTITKGQGKMASYASSITPEERWAIVLYVKALQRSRNANIEDVPVEQRSSLKDPPAAPAK
jgi:mono/diheme cytochrome c family protein